MVIDKSSKNKVYNSIVRRKIEKTFGYLYDKMFSFSFFSQPLRQTELPLLRLEAKKNIHLLASEGNEECCKSQANCPRLYLGHQFTCDFKDSLFYLSQLVIYYFFFIFFQNFYKIHQGFSRYFSFQSMKNRFFSSSTGAKA